jgi:predicted Zn-dependent peptidase
VSNDIHVHQFDNGLILVAESMDWLESAALCLLIRAGCAVDPNGLAGLVNFTCEMVRRGCGPRDSRQFVEDLENLGVDRSASVSNAHTSFGGAMPAENLSEALSIYADLVRRPHLPEAQFEEGRLVCFNEVNAIEDDLAQLAMQRLRRQFYADPYGRSSQGTLESIEQIQPPDVRNCFERLYGPDATILAVAGKFNWQRLKDRVGELFGDWSPQELPEITESPAERGYSHIENDSNQTHICIAYENVPYGHKNYYDARGAVGVLSDGMSSRLFTEVREKRGLCYTVYATCHSLRDRGSVICYAGTTTDRAQETLDVTMEQLRQLSAGIEQSELDRLKARIKTALIIQQESSFARSSSIAADWYFLGRVQTLDEVRSIVDNLSCDGINKYLAEHPPNEFCVVTLGAQPLEVRDAVS